MYLNDHQRSAFYDSLGLDTKHFDLHVIIEVCEYAIVHPLTLSFLHYPVLTTGPVLIRRTLLTLFFILLPSLLHFQTNKTSARIFPAVLDCENPEFERRMDNLVVINTKRVELAKSDKPEFFKASERLQLQVAMAMEILALYFMKPVDCGSQDFVPTEPQMVY